VSPAADEEISVRNDNGFRLFLVSEVVVLVMQKTTGHCRVTQVKQLQNRP
jgi:hypothetical protein